jgi:hypothetical protein
MAQGNVTLAEDLPDQQTSVTFVRAPATAQQGKTVLGRTAREAVDGGAEIGFTGHLRVERMARGIEMLLAPWSATQREPEKDVPHPARLQGGVKRLSVVLRRMARVRVGADVDDVRHTPDTE